MELHQSVGIITGASSGIGWATAKLLGEAGAKLVITARRAESLERLAGEIGKNVVIVPGDIVDVSLPQRLIDTAVTEFGQLDFVFNNAGVMNVGMIDEVDLDEMTAMIRINIEAMTRLAYLSLRHFKQRGRGYLINTSSIVGTKVRPGIGAYSGTKFYVEAFTEALRMELAGSGVRIAAIEPGYVKTELADHWTPAQREPLKGITRPLDPIDIARGVKFMLEQPDHVSVPTMLMQSSDQAM